MNTRSETRDTNPQPEVEHARILSPRERKLIELSLAIAARKQDQILQQVRTMHSEGFASTELLEVALLVATELNLPQALTWVNDGLEQVLDA
jgi:alkylhydroperoxidase/carboxymuconolactone decarboxylase family protein YurZ